jgi:hypothetical protein
MKRLLILVSLIAALVLLMSAEGGCGEKTPTTVISGTNGADGTNGVNGNSGRDGRDGQPGVSGSSGPVGTQGPAGNPGFSITRYSGTTDAAGNLTQNIAGVVQSLPPVVQVYYYQSGSYAADTCQVWITNGNVTVKSSHLSVGYYMVVIN